MSIKMSKKSGSKKESTVTKSVVPEVDPLDVSVSGPSTTPMPAKAPKKKQSKPKAEPTPAHPTPAEPVVHAAPPTPVASVAETNSVVEAVDQPSDLDLLSNVMNEFSTNLQALTSMLANLRTEFKNLSKVVNRELKQASKSSRRKRGGGGNKQPSGFVKPTLITEELATFLGREKGTEMARTEVTKEINQYIRANNLQDSKNGRHINPDAKLKKLLSYDGAETLTYFNLQKYLSPHFVKPTLPVA
jgi:chromatin remodeling complex protein RSC6